MKKWWVKSSDLKSSVTNYSARTRERFSIERFFYSFIAFILFLFLYYITNLGDLTYLFGFVSIVFFAMSILFLMSYLIFYFYARMRKSETKAKPKVQKKVVKKVTPKKSKKVTKAPSKPKKKVTKKTSKKK